MTVGEGWSWVQKPAHKAPVKVPAKVREASLAPDYGCTCTEREHDHVWGFRCERRATWAGGTCDDCRYWHTFPERKDNLG